jgi:signal transduction histidine kinase/DNA-binding response OmpR family regulator
MKRKANLRRQALLLAVVVAFSILPGFLSGCNSLFAWTDYNYERFTNFREIPGITYEEIAAIDALRYKYSKFIYAQPKSTEAFIDENGEIRGFAALVCEWLYELFDIEFVPEIRQFPDILTGFQEGEVHFTGTMTPTAERLEVYSMTDPIANRTLKYFRLKDSEPLSDIRTYRLPRFALLQGSSVWDKVMEALEPDSFEVVAIEDNTVVYELLKAGEIDAFIHENPTEAIFDAYTDIITADFLPVIVSPVSLTAYDDEFAPIISVMQKAIENGGIRYLTKLYNDGLMEYTKHKLFVHLTEQERRYIQNRSTVRFAGEHDNYPVSFYNPHYREFQGISHDVIKEIALLTGLEFELVNDQHTDWSEILVMLENGQASMVTELIRTPERKGRFLWPDTAVLTDKHTLISTIEQPDIRINEIMHMRVGVAAGYAHTEIFNQWFPYHRHVTVYDNFDRAFAALGKGDIDVVMGSQYKLLYQTNFREQPGYKANIIFDYSYESTFGFNKEEAVLCSIIDKALQVIDTELISAQWTRRTFDFRVKLQQQQIVWMIGAVVMFFFVLFLLYLSWAKKRLEKESKYKSQFMATMSHEIRTPMNAIIGIAQIQLQKENQQDNYSPAQIQSMSAFEKIYTSGNNLLGIINDILDMSKIETGRLELNPIVYDISSLISDVVHLNAVRIGSKPIEFILDVKDDLPSKLYGDDLRIKQILNNLLSNAIKYTEKGSVKLSVVHSMQDSQVQLGFMVKDTGQGMKPEDKKRLFTEYSRFNIEANRVTEGTGLGLSIVKNLVDLMDGTISVETVYNRGSIFTVLIKQGMIKCSPVGSQVAQKLKNFSFSTKRINQKVISDIMPYGRVLIVDDVKTNLFVAQGLMSPYKLNIETADSGFEAIEKFRSGNEYDVIFMDHMMPKMDGMQTTAQLREQGFSGAIVALTANALVGSSEKFLQNGFDEFISKPINVKQLDEVLDRFIRKRYPDEAKKYAHQSAANTASTDEAVEINPRLKQAFLHDAQKAISTLRKTYADEDFKLFTTTAHAMRSALANIGENKACETAAALEKAAIGEDREFIRANIDGFINILETLTEEFTVGEYNQNTTDDTVYLSEQLRIIKTACENYDDDTALSALDLLNKKSWIPETAAVIEEIYGLISMDSDFEEAAVMIEALLAD